MPSADCNRLKACKDCNKKCFLIHHSKASNSAGLSFFKVMDGKCSPFLEIPSPHAEQIKSNGCRYVILEGPTGFLGDIILCCCGTSPSFKDGWENFVSYHSIQDGDIIVFRNTIDTNFIVQIFHPSGYEKQITHEKKLARKDGCDLCKNQTLGGFSAKHPLTLDSKKESHCQQSPVPSCSHETDHKPKVSRALKDPVFKSSPTENLRPGKFEKRSELKFTKVMNKAAVTHSFWLTIPIRFARHWFPQAKVEMVLLCQRKTWRVTYVGTGLALGIGPGWKYFVVDNQLKIGDTCEFELKDTKKYIFRVKISRA